MNAKTFLFKPIISTILLFTITSLHSANYYSIHPVNSNPPVPSIFKELATGKKVGRNKKLGLFIDDIHIIDISKKGPYIPVHTNSTARIATYNVHFWTDPYEKPNYDEIMQAIKNINADILVLQEVVMFDKDKIETDLKGMGYVVHEFSRTLQTKKGPFGNLIASKYPLAQKALIQTYYVDKNEREERTFINIIVKLPNNELLSVWGTHLDVFDETEKRRIGEILELLKLMKADTTKHKMFLADFNAVRSSDYQYEVKGKNVWDLVVADDKARTGIATPTKTLELIDRFGFIDSFTKTASPKPKFTVWSGKVVDFIWLDKNWQLPIIGSYVYYNAASDHCPVLIDVDLSKPTNEVEKAQQKSASFFSKFTQVFSEWKNRIRNALGV